MYVAAQAWHDYHSGFDYSFFMNKHGCYTRDIASHPNFSNTLALVVDKAGFDSKATSFHELSLFGEKQLLETMPCGNDVTVHIFTR